MNTDVKMTLDANSIEMISLHCCRDGSGSPDVRHFEEVVIRTLCTSRLPLSF
jgi:hypothetical protein